MYYCVDVHQWQTSYHLTRKGWWKGTPLMRVIYFFGFSTSRGRLSVSPVLSLMPWARGIFSVALNTILFATLSSSHYKRWTFFAVTFLQLVLVALEIRPLAANEKICIFHALNHAKFFLDFVHQKLKKIESSYIFILLKKRTSAPLFKNFTYWVLWKFIVVRRVSTLDSVVRFGIKAILEECLFVDNFIFSARTCLHRNYQGLTSTSGP